MYKADIRNLTLGELEKALIGINERPYRAKQLFSWMYRTGADDFSEVSNIPRTLQKKLEEKYSIGRLEPHKHLKSTDGTEKIAFKLPDGNFIESVLINAKNRKTICLSTQVGCKFACAFCASGGRAFVRNLSVSEIIGQILHIKNKLKHKITNYVFMGMGEPLDNYENVTKAVLIMNDPEGMDIGARRITISTCGIIPGIEKLKTLGLQVNLSVSLHATNNELRNKLAPVNRIYPLEKLIEACDDFIEKTGRLITIEYVLIKDVNDSVKDADEIALIARRLKTKVNVIQYSAISGGKFKAPQKKDASVFMKRLIGNGVNATERKSKGKDIRAACGQLAGLKKNRRGTRWT